MTRLTPILDKLYARRRAREESEDALDTFYNNMLSIVESDMNIDRCQIKVVHKIFANQGREIQVTFRLDLGEVILDKPFMYELKIEKLPTFYMLSSGGKTRNVESDKPESAADGFFSLLNAVI